MNSKYEKNRILVFGQITTLLYVVGSLCIGAEANSCHFNDKETLNAQPGGIWKSRMSVCDVNAAVFAADEENGKVHKVDLNDNSVHVLLGGAATSGSLGQGDGHLATSSKVGMQPFHMCGDDSGVVYVVDSLGGRVRKIDTDSVISTFAGVGGSAFTGSETSLGDGGAATSAVYHRLSHCVVDSNADVYLASTNDHKVRKVLQSTGMAIQFAGTGVAGSLNGDLTSASLALPYNMFIDSVGNFFVSEHASGLVRKSVLGSNQLTTFSGFVSQVPSVYGGDGGPATSASFPGRGLNIAMDIAGNMFIASDSTGIRVVSSDTGVVNALKVAGTEESVGADGLHLSPQFMHADGQDLYLTESGRNEVVKITCDFVERHLVGCGGAPSFSPTVVPSRVPTTVPSIVPSVAPSTATPSIEPSETPSSPPSASPSVQPSAVPSATPTATPSEVPTLIPSSSPTDVPSAAPSAQPSVVPSAVPSVAPTATPSEAPTIIPSSSPTDVPSAAPSAQPSVVPSAVPSVAPTATPSEVPTIIPSSTPTDVPSAAPSAQPSAVPSAVPSIVPSESPSVPPSDFPTASPSIVPSQVPSNSPTVIPSETPSITPSEAPSSSPTVTPSAYPSETPSEVPTVTPSMIPSATPSVTPSTTPTDVPSAVPSTVPSETPTHSPSEVPSKIPSYAPSVSPSEMPSETPSEKPSAAPSANPSLPPSQAPSAIPSVVPSAPPSKVPSAKPSITPSTSPSAAPSVQPSASPSQQPTKTPSAAPSEVPSGAPSDPSFAPTPRPSTTRYVDITFDASLYLNNVTVSELDAKSQMAVVTSVSLTIGVDVSKLTFVSQTVVSSSTHRALATQTVYQILSVVNVKASTGDFVATENDINGDNLYTKLKDDLEAAVTSNAFTQMVRDSSVQLEAEGTTMVADVAFEASPYAVVLPDEGENDDDLTAGELSGIVIGAVVGALLLVIIAWAACFANKGAGDKSVYPETKAQSSAPQQQQANKDGVVMPYSQQKVDESPV